MKTIKYPTNNEIEKILDKWSDRHGDCWDYEDDKNNVRKALISYKKLIDNKNKTLTKL